MKITISVRITDARQWLVRLREALEQQGHEVHFRIWGQDTRPGLQITALKALEYVLFGRSNGLWARGDLNRINPRKTDLDCDLMIDLSAEPALQPEALAASGHGELPVLRMMIEGQAGIHHVIEAILAQRVPSVEIRDRDGAVVFQALPALEEMSILLRSLSEFYLRIILVLQSAIAKPAALIPQPKPIPRASIAGQNPLIFVIRTVLRKIWSKMRRKTIDDDHWRVGIRLQREENIHHGDHLIDGFAWLPDDGQRYYADPILFEWQGRDFLFVEEFPYATRKGILSVVELDRTGAPMGVPQPIITLAGHLSYPLIFTHQDEIYMMPENAAQGRVPVFRAVHFPFEWVQERDLIDLPLHDATLFQAGETEVGDTWHLLGNHQLNGVSSWDCLMAYRAPSPFGPWQADPNNPLMIDARFARSAGPVLEMNGRLIRPVQSCLGGYGRFLRFMEIENLAEGQFSQRETGRILPPLNSQISGVHTYCRNDRFEVIDICGLTKL